MTLWRRYLRLSPAIAWREFWHPILNRGQVLQGLLAVIGLRIILPQSSLPERVALANEWGLWFQAFGFACLTWAIISAIRAPFIVRAEDKSLGALHGNRFVYHAPQLAATIHCKPTGEIEMYKFDIPHVEPGSFVYCHVDVEGPRHLAEIGLGGWMLTGVQRHHAERRTGFSLAKGSTEAILQVRLPTNAVSATVRIYCHCFIIGEPQDQDGTTGNYKFPLRPPPKSDGGRRIP